MSRVALLYVAGPYRSPKMDGVFENIYRARSVAKKLWAMGAAVLTPHMNTAFLDGAVAEGDDDVWLEGDLEMLRRCDALVLVPGWEASKGTAAERAFALAHDLPVFEAHEEAAIREFIVTHSSTE